MKKSVLSLALVAAMGATFVACNDNNGRQVENPAGDAEVQIGMSIFSGKSAQNAPAQYAPAEDVYYQDGNTYDYTQVNIENIFVVPMRGEETQKPVKLNDVSGQSSTSTPTKLIINSNTDRFLVYANLSADEANSISTTAPFDKTILFRTKAITPSDPNSLYYPHNVYLFADAKRENGNLKVAYEADVPDAAAWAGITWADYNGEEFGSDAALQKNCIKVTGVTYAIGTLAVGVYHGNYENIEIDGETIEKVVYVGGNEDANKVPLTEDWLAANVSLEGITIADQAEYMGYLFRPGTNYVTVYDNMDNGANAKVIKSRTLYESGTGKLAFGNLVEKANTFVVVAPSVEQKDVIINLVFTNKNAQTIKFGENGVTIQPNGKFYLAAKLTPKDGHPSVFEKATTTILNAKITGWEKATTEIQVATDVHIGIEVDLTWKEGVVYDEEI